MRTHTLICASMLKLYVAYAYTSMYTHARVSKTMKYKFSVLEFEF